MTGFRSAVTTGAVLLVAALATAQEWSRLDPESVIVIDTSKGRLVIEARPEMAPQAVARVKRLAREGVYDGLQIHRVVEHFVAQTGNPNNRDGGASAYPNLPPEFTFRIKPGDATLLAVKSSDGVGGFLGSVPFAGAALAEAERANDGMLRAWGAYCPGVAGMGRQAERDTANSEIFFMLEAARRLDRDYTVWGRIVDGMSVLRSFSIGSPPPTPDVMRRVRVLADFPVAERFSVNLPPASVLAASVDDARRRLGADFSICDVEVAARITTP